MRRTHAIALALAAIALAGVPAFAQSCATGGTLGKSGKSISGAAADNGTKPARRVLPKTNIPAIKIISATYGGNCGAQFGNMTSRLADACDGKRICDYRIDYKVIGDPAFLCGKDYVARWSCGGNGQTESARIAPEAGYGKVVSIQCQ